MGNSQEVSTQFLNINSQENRSFCHKGLSTHKPKTAPYKTLAKVVPNRIREIIHEDIDGNQFAFVKDRNILDCIFIANESIEDNHRQKKKVLFLNWILRKHMTTPVAIFLIM